MLRKKTRRRAKKEGHFAESGAIQPPPSAPRELSQFVGGKGLEDGLNAQTIGGFRRFGYASRLRASVP
jgi:hypothetical protein